MGIYLINFLTIPLYKKLFKDKKIFLDVICFQMWLIMVFRSSRLGDDVNNYAQYYNLWATYSIKEMILSTRFILNHDIIWGLESGYTWVCYLCAHVGFSFQFFLVIHSTICMLGLRKLLLNYSKSPDYSMLIIIAFGIWGTFFYVLRQSFAFVALIWAFQNLIDKKNIKFFIYCVIAIMFHRSSIVFIAIYFIRKINITSKNIIILSLMCIGCLLLVPKIYFFIGIYLSIFGKANLYQLGEFQPNIMIICFIFLFLFILLFSHRLTLFYDEKNKLLFWCFLLAIVIEIFSLYIPDFSRIAICELFPFGAILLGNVIENLSIESNRRIIKRVGFILLFVLYIYILKGASYVPYIPFWN